MMIVRRAVLPLRVLLVLTFALLVVFQVLSMPGQFAHMAHEHPDDAWLRWPMTAWSTLEIGCVEVVIVCTWRLLGLVQADRIFTERALAWVDVIVAAVGTGWLLLAVLWVFVGVQADDPGAPMLLTLLLLIGAVIGLLMLVLRELLRQATTLRSDMEAVI